MSKKKIIQDIKEELDHIDKSIEKFNGEQDPSLSEEINDYLKQVADNLGVYRNRIQADYDKLK